MFLAQLSKHEWVMFCNVSRPQEHSFFNCFLRSPSTVVAYELITKYFVSYFSLLCLCIPYICYLWNRWAPLRSVVKRRRRRIAWTHKLWWPSGGWSWAFWHSLYSWRAFCACSTTSTCILCWRSFLLIGPRPWIWAIKAFCVKSVVFGRRNSVVHFIDLRVVSVYGAF